jgi:hypothetical protein
MTTNRAICTIIAKNYLASARTLCETYRSLHPDDRCFVLVVDEHKDSFDPAKENFELIDVERLAIPDFYPKFAFKYNITELSTAVKPYLLELLLREMGVDKLLYIDPDIMVLQKLDGLYAALDRSDIVLTPHIDADFPEDGRLPDDSGIMSTGLFNLGFIGVNSSENTHKFLKWWQGKLYNKCVIDYAAGYFVDQKFLDIAQFFFDRIHIEKDTGYNVAPHNLHSRFLSAENGVWLCNGKPLYFYHFCGYIYSNPTCVSKYYSYKSRYNFDNRPDLVPLYSHYRDRLRANGHELTSQWQYTYGYFDTGEWIIDPLRKQYRKSLEMQSRCADPFVLASFRRHCPEFKRLMGQAAVQKAYKAMTTGDYRHGTAHLKEAYAYDHSSLFDPLARAYTKWAAKLWFKDQTRRLSTRWRSSAPNGGA